MLRVKDLVAGYGGVSLLKRVNIEVGHEEFVTVLGPNGAGKTTLFSVILGLLQPIHGEIFFENERIDGMPTYKIVSKGIALCPERKKLAPGMTVIENLMMGAYLCKDKEKIKADLKQIFDLLPVLNERRHQLAGKLSGGERQMLNLGRALMMSPRLLLLDEPSLGLAPKIKLKIYEEIERIYKMGIAILLAEQDATVALKYAGRGYLLEHGEISLAGTSEKLLKNDYIREVYLGI